MIMIDRSNIKFLKDYTCVDLYFSFDNKNQQRLLKGRHLKKLKIDLLLRKENRKIVL